MIVSQKKPLKLGMEDLILRHMAFYFQRVITVCLCITLCLTTSQIKAQKKYQSLMWEITGQQLSKPSYIYGTMHVSGKMVFHLGEPFYDALKGVDVLALELEPEAWLQAAPTPAPRPRRAGTA